MNFIPNNIPRSLQPYLDQFQKQPEKAIERLEKHLEKRGPDAVGYYLLAWFYHHSNSREKAVKTAWKARIFAPGSPAVKELHYYMQHPEQFNAWNPARLQNNVSKKAHQEGEAHPIHDLDALINKLSSTESKKIQLQENQGEDKELPDLSEYATNVDDIFTETMADIHEKQGNREAAIKTYEELKKLHPDKARRYKKEIKRLQKELQNHG